MWLRELVGVVHGVGWSLSESLPRFRVALTQARGIRRCAITLRTNSCESEVKGRTGLTEFGRRSRGGRQMLAASSGNGDLGQYRMNWWGQEVRKEIAKWLKRIREEGAHGSHRNHSPEQALSAAVLGESWAAWWREGRIDWGKMVVGRWGSYSRCLDRKRSRINAHLCRAITGRDCSCDVVAGAVWGRR